MQTITENFEELESRFEKYLETKEDLIDISKMAINVLCELNDQQVEIKKKKSKILKEVFKHLPLVEENQENRMKYMEAYKQTKNIASNDLREVMEIKFRANQQIERDRNNLPNPKFLNLQSAFDYTKNLKDHTVNEAKKYMMELGKKYPAQIDFLKPEIEQKVRLMNGIKCLPYGYEFDIKFILAKTEEYSGYPYFPFKSKSIFGLMEELNGYIEQISSSVIDTTLIKQGFYTTLENHDVFFEGIKEELDMSIQDIVIKIISTKVDDLVLLIKKFGFLKLANVQITEEESIDLMDTVLKFANVEKKYVRGTKFKISEALQTQKIEIESKKNLAELFKKYLEKERQKMKLQMKQLDNF